jgi:N-acetylglucosaminyl-diphospho-decaprenol L-rhamnosyltransferase
MSTGFSVSIVIITRNTKELLGDLLRSIGEDESLASCLKEIVVVDNGSSDGTVEMVREEFPSLLLVRYDVNRGFAAAANEGIRRSSGDFVLFLNSDTLLIKGEINKLLAFMCENKDVGICGPRLVYQDMGIQRSFASLPSLVLEICPAGLLELIFPRKYPGKGAGLSDPLAVDSLIGAAIVARKDILALLKGFDERFFFFMEETDLCIRMREKGYRVIFFPGTRVMHLQGKTVRKSWVKGRIEYNISLYKFVGKHHKSVYLGVFVIIRFVKAICFLALSSLLPFFLIRRKTRLSYVYYLNLLMWHLRGCPDSRGLRASGT